MSAFIFTPIVEIKNDFLVRRSGFFYREKIKLSDIWRIVAVVKDALTHEEIVVIFYDDLHARVFLSEFDRNSSEVMNRLQHILPGLSSFSDLIANKPFGRAEKVLWERNRGESFESAFR